MSKPAFPRPFSEPHANVEDDYFAITPSQDGMSLLEYYAGQALIAVVSSEKSLEALNSLAQENNDSGEHAVSVVCFNIAEAMIKESEKRNL